MTLEDFEKQLAEEKVAEQKREKKREKASHKDRSDHSRRHHHHHRRPSGDNDRADLENEHRSKRRKHDDREDKEQRHHRSRRHREHPSPEADLALKSPTYGGPEDGHLKRDSWMEAPSALDIDYVHRKREQPAEPSKGSLGADYELKIHRKELNHHLKDLQSGGTIDDIKVITAKHEVDYKFGDAGSSWRMTRLKAVYREAKDSARAVDDVALDRYDSLRDFDDAREEEIELKRRQTYGKDYVGKDRPNGDLFQERKTDAGIHETERSRAEEVTDPGNLVEDLAVPAATPSVAGQKTDQTALNKMKAGLLKAKLRKDANLPQMQAEYDAAVAASHKHDPTVVTLSAMDSRMLSSASRSEAKPVQNRRGAERGEVEENEDMSIDDMVREERRTRNQAGGEGKRFAERIAKDGKFDNDLDYMDENASKLAKRVHKSDINLRNVAINEYQKLSKILESCPLCHHEDTETPPIAPVVSLATRTFLTLPTEPELASYGALIVPVDHRTNLLECDDDEWEEIRNFMKCLTRFYHDQGRDVIFYENAAHPHRKPHAALTAMPLPYSLGETAPAFFKEAFLTTEDEWSQHKKIIDTLAKSRQGAGKLAFRRSLAKEMPYFHVWFELDGGLGHIVEDAQRWPKGDLFAREIVGGILGLEPDVIKRQGRWHRGHDSRMEEFRTKWKRFDWTRALTDS